jgi:muramoyltetrapeptide carboxypeptidase LdcA involved in peptidoglycan recycling
MHYPPKPRPGDRVAVVSPSAGGPARFPEVYELGLRRLRETFGLVPVEYPTTRAPSAGARDRAADLMAAFADPSITAVLASIGGEDQITVTPYLDDAVLLANPKPFFGYSDNTNLLNHLYRLGLVGYHGGSVMVHLGRAGHLHPAHAATLRAALFTDEWFTLVPPAEWGDEPILWTEPERFGEEPPMVASSGWDWVNADSVVQGLTWGGNLEVLAWLLMADRILPPAVFHGQVLLLETSEEMPSAQEVYWVLRSMGERGLLQQFAAILVARPKAWDLGRDRDWEPRRAYARDQRAAFDRALAEYAPSTPAVFDVDFGHTDPQLVIPYGGDVIVDGPARRIQVRY